MLAIDLHTHLPGTAFGARPWPTDDFLTMLDAAGIERAVVMTVDGIFRDPAAANDRLVAQAQESGGRLIPFGTVDPYDPDAAAEVRRCVEGLGFRGLKLHPPLQGFSPLAEQVIPVAVEAARLGVPILFHDGTPPYSTPLQIASLTERVPGLTVILGHGGRMDLWIEAVAAARRYPNCFICVCGVEPPAIFARIIRDVGVEKVALGTDCGWERDPYLARFRMAQFRELARDLPAADQYALFRGTAARLLGLVDDAQPADLG